MAQQIQLRNDTTAGWASSNPTLAQGEFGINTTTGEFKIGDGNTAWADLPYHGTALTDLNLIKAGLWNYPSNNGVVIQTSQHNESIAIKSNQSAALRWHIRDDGSFVGSDSLVILSHNQSLSDGSAVGFNITEREVAPVTGHYYYVNIDTGDTQFNGQYLCVASTTTTITFDYVNDVSAYDTTGITGTIGLPSIYNQVESRSDGVWIKNANWSDPSSYAYYWHFGTDGVLSGPAMGGLIVNGLSSAQGNDLNIGAYGTNNKVVISGDGGEFLNDTADINQIATVGYVAQAKSTYGPIVVYYSEPLTGDFTHVGSLLYASMDGDNPHYLIPSNDSMAFPIGSEIKFATNGTCSWYIDRADTNQTTLIGEGSNGYTGENYTFIVPSNSTATLLKVDTERWILSSLRLTD